MKISFSKLLFSSGTLTLIFLVSATVIQWWFPQRLNTIPSTITPPPSSVMLDAQGTSTTLPLARWLVSSPEEHSQLTGFTLLGVSFVDKRPQLSRVVLSQTGSSAKSFALGGEVAAGVVVAEIFPKGVRLKTTSGEEHVLVLPKKIVTDSTLSPIAPATPNLVPESTKAPPPPPIIENP
jgi:hypothetical protein